jgi:hypothetical protein
MDSKNSTSASSSSFGRFKPAIAFVTLVTFIATTLWTPGVSFAAATMSEVNLPYQAVLDTNLRFALPRDIGKIEDLKLGRGPGVVHIQTAHGHYDAQQKIRQILHHLDKHYGIRTLLVEGSAFRLRPELLNFFPRDPKLTAKVADRLTKSAIVKGPELYLLDKVRHPGSAEGYGIEEASAYRANGEAFVEVLTQKEKTSGFLAQMNEGIERLSAPYLNDNLRKFVRTQESFEKKIMPPDAWFTYLKEESSRTLKLELGDPAEQLEWPMITRLFMIRKLQRELDAKKLPKERDSFLKAIRRFIPGAGVCAAVEKILKNDPVSQPLPDPETSLLFEEMTRQLPQDFNYALFPNVRAFIGTLILTSELKAAALMNETGKLTDAVTDKLARTATEKTVISLLKDYRLLQKLFALELTPADYEALLKRTTELTPSVIAKRFEKAVAGSSKRVKDVRFRHTGELDALYASALKFYEGVKARDLAMIGMIEKRLLETGADKVAVVTGGFHSEPFRDYFSSRGYTYALVSPRITDADKAGYEAYINHTLQTVAGRPSPVAGIKPVTSGQSPVTRSTRESPFVSASPAELRAMGVDAEALARAEYRAALPVLAGNPGAARALALQLRAETREDPVREVAGTDALINLIVDNLLKAVSSDRYLILTALGNKTTLAQVGEEFPDVSQEIYETLGGEGFNNEEAEVFFENHHRAIISALARAEARERSTAKPQTRANDLLAALLKAFKRSGDFQAFLRDVQTILKVFFFHETTDGKIYKMQLAGAGVKWVKDIGDMRYEYLNNRLWNLPMRAKLFGDIAVTFIDGKFGVYILSDAPRRLPIVTRTGKSSTVVSKKGNKVLTVVGEIPFEDTAMASVLLDPKQTIWNFRKRPDGLHFIVRSTNGTVHLDKVISEERSGSGTELRPRRSTEFGGFLPLVFINSNMIVNALGFLSYAAIAAGAGLFVFAFYSLYRYGGHKKQDNVPEETSPRKRAEARMSDPVYDKDLEAARNLLRREKGNLSVMENNRKLLAANPKAYHPRYREFKQLASLDNQIAARKALIKQLEADVQERETVPARSEWRTGEESPSPIYDEMLLWDLKNGNHGRQREREAWFERVANEPILRNFLASNLPELLNHQDPWVRDFSRKLLARINAMPRRSEMRGDLPRATDDELRFMKAPDRFMEELKQDPNFRYLGGFDNHETYRPEQAVLKLDGGQELVFLRMMRSHYYTDWGPISPYHFILKNKDDTFSVKQEPASGLGMYLSFTAGGKDARGIPYNRDISVLGLSRAGSKHFVLFAAEESVASILQQFKTVRFSVGQVKGLPVTVEWRAVPEDFWISKEGKRMLARHSAIRGNAQLEGARLGRVAFKDAQGRPDVPFLRRLQSLWEDASRGKHHTDILEALSDILNDFHMMLMAGGNWMMENRIGKLMEGVSEDALFRALALRFATEGPEAMRLFLDQLKGKGSDVSKEILCAYLTGFLTREVRRQLVTPKPAPESQRAELRAGAVKAVETPALPSYIRTVGVDTWQVPVNSLVNAIEMIVRFKQSDLPIEVRTGEFRHYSERGVQLALVSRMTRMIKDRATKAEIRIVKGKLRVRPVGAKPRVEMPGQRSLVSRQELRAGEGIRHGETTVALTRDEIKAEVIRLISEESVVPYQDGDQVGTVLDSVYVSDLELKLEEVYKLPDGYLWNRISVQSTADDIAQTVFDFVDARAIRAGAAGIRAEMRVGATAAEIARGVGLFAGTLRPTGIRGTVRPSQDADFREIQMSQWPETGRKEDASRGAGLVARGVVAFATAAAGASSRQSTDKVPAGALSMIDKLHGKGHKLMSKGATPIGEYGDRVYSYMGLMLTDIGMLLREVSSAVSGASTSKNRVLIMTNANYQEELNEELKRNGFYGIPGEQFVRNQGRIGFQQDLAPKFYLSERDIPKAYATAVKASPEVPIEEHNARRDASIQKAREVEAAIANGHPEAVIHPTERDPAGHAEFFHQMVSKGILLDLIDAGIKYIPFRNIDNAAATYDANFLTLLGWMDRKGYDAIFEVSRRGPGMKGGAWMIGQRGNHRIAEDPSIEATWKRIVADYEKDGWRRQLQIDPATGKGKTPEKLPAGVLSDLEAKIMAGQSIEIEPTDLSYETETIMTVKGLRQLANADKEKEESRIAVFRNAEGDYRLIRKVNSADVVGMNNAVAIYTPKYIADIYRRDATQSFDDFVNEMRDARSKGTLEKLAERGRAKLPLLFDPKPSKDLSVIGLGKAEGNMHEVTGEVSDNVRVRAVGTASLREFDMDRFNALSDYDKAAFMDRVVFRFLATKQWEGPVESWVANLKLYPIIIKRVMEGRRVDIQELRKNGLQGYDGTAGALRAEARISRPLPTTSVAVNAVPANTQDGFGVKDLEPDLRRITMPSFLAFVRHLRFGIFPETVRQAVMERFRHGTEVLGMLMAKVGISKASAATRAPETALLDKYFTAGQRTELVMSPEDLESNGTFYVSGSFMNRFIREDAGTLFDILKIYRDKARAAGVKTLLKTSGDAGMFEEMIKALYRKNAVAPKDFRERDEIVAALKSGEILGIHVLAAGQTEVGVVKTLTASLDGKIATLFDDEAVLELLEGGNNFAVTANVGRGDLKLIGRLIVELSSVAELSGDTLLKVLEDIVPNYGKKGTSGFTIGALTIASIAERFVERALIARSA